MHFGSPHASRVVAAWCAELADEAVPAVLVDPFGAFEDPERRVSSIVGADPGELLRLVLNALAPALERDTAWLSDWRRADDAAEEAIAAVLDGPSELDRAGDRPQLFGAVRAGSTLVASSSMPVRDLEWFAPRRRGAPLVLSNRGANGIDGVTSTVLGVAASAAGRVVGLIGDLAFFHDLSGLVWGRTEDAPDATLVVVDNSGGGIFSFLAYPDLVSDAVFERGFGTPQRPAPVTVAAALGWHAEAVEDVDELGRAVAEAEGRSGVSVIAISTERRANVELHTRLNAAVAEAVDAVL